MLPPFRLDVLLHRHDGSLSFPASILDHEIGHFFRSGESPEFEPPGEIPFTWFCWLWSKKSIKTMISLRWIASTSLVFQNLKARRPEGDNTYVRTSFWFMFYVWNATTMLASGQFVSPSRIQTQDCPFYDQLLSWPLASMTQRLRSVIFTALQMFAKDWKSAIARSTVQPTEKIVCTGSAHGTFGTLFFWCQCSIPQLVHIVVAQTFS